MELAVLQHHRASRTKEFEQFHMFSRSSFAGCLPQGLQFTSSLVKHLVSCLIWSVGQCKERMPIEMKTFSFKVARYIRHAADPLRIFENELGTSWEGFGKVFQKGLRRFGEVIVKIVRRIWEGVAKVLRSIWELFDNDLGRSWEGFGKGSERTWEGCAQDLKMMFPTNALFNQIWFHQWVNWLTNQLIASSIE